MKRSFFYLLLFLLLVNFSATAQILNDSTQNIYGTKTTKIYYEDDYLRGNYNLLPVDTSLTNLHQSRNWYHDSTFFQDLGNVGTAAKPLLWRSPQRIGVRLGRNAFDRYAYDPSRINYFDTKSPYTHLFYVQGGLGEQIFEAKHSRSFKKLANFGFSFERMSGERQFGGARTNESQLQHTGFVFFTHLQNESGKYHLFANYVKFDHDIVEPGGIKLVDNPTETDVFDFDDGPVLLNQAANEEKRDNIHLTQFYTLAKEYIKVFHSLDYRHQTNKFFDNEINPENNPAFPIIYPAFRADHNKTNDLSVYREFENTVGITGNHPLFVYKLYARRRDATIRLSTDSTGTNPDTTLVFESLKRKYGQNFIGGETQFRLKDIFNINVNAEYQLFQDYVITAAAKIKYFTFAQSRSSYSPSITQQYMVSNHFKWDNNFDNIVSDRTSAMLEGTLWRNTLKAEVARVNLQNYVIYNTEAKPEQLGKQLSFYTGYLQHHLRLKNFNATHIFSYNHLRNAEEIRLPKWLISSRIYYQGALFKNALFGQVGVETYVTDDYYADAYSPVTQQFYLQNNFKVPTFNDKVYPVVDLFLAVDIKNFNGFIKMSHINQGFPKNSYFSTPYYPGLGRSLVFGIKWMFFD